MPESLGSRSKIGKIGAVRLYPEGIKDGGLVLSITCSAKHYHIRPTTPHPLGRRTQVSVHQVDQYWREMITGRIGVLDLRLNNPEKGEVADLREAPNFR